MKRLISTLILFLGLALSLVSGAAQAVEPDALIRNVTEEVLTILRQDKEIRAGDANRVADLVGAKVLPHFNFGHMTALAVGREWRKATPEQQKQLTDEFRTLLVRTYSNALTSYRNQTVQYKPFRMQPTDTDVTVRTQVVQPGAKPVGIDYSLEKNSEEWKVYDVVVGGVSLVTNYRETFATEIRNGGIEGLLKALKGKNQRGEITPATNAAK
ncbi:MAG: ABC transporter substrate-binding protein [Betaproteobacteria bacterium]|nr:ABC transporter substrate-binding protein [Betaproteobacteria bacterium]